MPFASRSSTYAGLLVIMTIAAFARLHLLAWTDPSSSRTSQTATARVAAAPRQADPAPGTAIDGEVWLPALRLGPLQESCYATIGVQNLGLRPSLGVLVAFPRHADCGDAQGAVRVTCTGLIRPGRGWTIHSNQLGGESDSAAFYNLSSEAVSSIDPSVATDRLIGDRICQLLAEAGDRATFRSFQSAYRDGGEFDGIPMEQARGGPVAVSVQRSCSTIIGIDPVYWTSGYRGLGASEITASGQATPPHRYRVDGAAPAAELYGSTAIIQNAGRACATVDVYATSFDSCAAPELCRQIQIAAGASLRLPLADCGGDLPVDGLVLSSDQPLAIMLDEYGPSGLASSTGWPSPIASPPAPDAATSRLVLPTLLGDDSVRTIVSVRNLDPDRPSQVSLTVLDASGAVLDRRSAEICAGGAQRIEARLDPGPGRPRQGMVVLESRAESVFIGSPDRAGRPQQDAPPIHAELLRIDEAGSGSLFKQALLPDPRRGDGVGLLAFPAIYESPDIQRLVSEIVIGNAAIAEGRTEMAVMVFDANGLVDSICLALEAGASASLDLRDLTALPNGFTGHALVSATDWSHADGSELGLAAVAIERTGPERGAGLSGDALGARAGRPADAALGRWLAGWLQRPPRCPQEPALPRGPRPPEGSPMQAHLAELHLPLASHVESLPGDPTANPPNPREGSCRVGLEVRNDGVKSIQVLVIAQAAFSNCPPEQAMPISIACSGILAPNGQWTISASQLEEVHTVDLYSLTTTSLDELGIRPGDPRPASEALCESVRATSSAADLRAFRTAFREGRRFGGLPLARVYGGPISGRASRDCAWPEADVTGVTSDYAAIARAESVHSRAGEAGDGYVYAVPRVYSDRDGQTTILALQNVGPFCATAGLRFTDAQGELLPLNCQAFIIPPAESMNFRIREWCLEAGELADVRITSNQPLAIVAEDVGIGSQSPTLNTFPVFAGANAFDLDGDLDVDRDDLELLEAGLGSLRSSPAWNGRLDVWPDGEVNEDDRLWLLQHLGSSPTPTPLPSSTATQAVTPGTPGGSETASPSPQLPETPIWLPFLVFGR